MKMKLKLQKLIKDFENYVIIQDPGSQNIDFAFWG